MWEIFVLKLQEVNNFLNDIQIQQSFLLKVYHVTLKMKFPTLY